MAFMAWHNRAQRNQRGTFKTAKGQSKSQKTIDLLNELATMIDELTESELQWQMKLRGITWMPSRAALALCLEATYQWQRVEILIVDHGRQSSARYPTYTKIGQPLGISKQRAQEIVDDLVYRHKHAIYKNDEYCLKVEHWIRILADLSELDKQFPFLVSSQP